MGCLERKVVRRLACWTFGWDLRAGGAGGTVVVKTERKDESAF